MPPHLILGRTVRRSLAVIMLGFSLPFFGPFAAAAASPTFRQGINISHWLSQNYPERPYAADWFGESDVAWIADQGFDHIRFPIDGRLWLQADGSLDESKIKPFEQALAWARARDLGVILDMHFLPGASFDPTAQESSLFTDRTLQHDVANFWRHVARRFADADAGLRFEILNEPVAEENQQLNALNRVLLAAIRESNPTRTVYLTSNRWSGFSTLSDVVLPDDPHVALTLHYYEPMIFTHQRASWVEFPDDMPVVTFPGTAPDLTGTVRADHWVLQSAGHALTAAAIEADFIRVARWVKQQAPDVEVHIGEFGVYDKAPDDSRERWTKAVRESCERHGFGWAVWDYRGGFAVRDAAGEGTAILQGLFPPKRATP